MKRLIKYWLFISLGLCCLPLSQAQSQCYRHTECDDDQLCINAVCTTPEEPLTPCETEETCEEKADECGMFKPCSNVCDDGYCKLNAVYCENPAGFCYIGATGIFCSCSGQGSVGSAGPAISGAAIGTAGMGPGPDGSVPEDVFDVTDEELYQECQVSLVDACGDKLPDIHDECTDEQIELCAEAYEFVNPFIISCGFMDAEEVAQNSDRNLWSCCTNLDEHMEEYMEAFECIKDLDLDDCDGFQACIPEDREDSDSNGYDEDEITTSAEGHRVLGADEANLQEDSNNDSDDTDSGCSVRPMPGKSSQGVLYSFISLMTLLFIRTRKRL